jgi:protein SCO1/2
MLSTMLPCVLLAIINAQAPSPRLAIISDAPDFTLVNQHSKTVKLSDFKGKVLLVSFIFTTCNGSCPATTHRMAKVEQLLNSRINFRPQVEFVTITLDPKRDTPEALRNYIQLFDLQTTNKAKWFGWTFVTGSSETVAKTITDWGMWVKPGLNGQLDHPSRIFLVDRNLKIREIYNVDLLRYWEVAADIEDLWAEMHKR